MPVTDPRCPLRLSDIYELLPHARPFVMLESVYELEPGSSGSGTMSAVWEQLWGLESGSEPQWPDVFIIESAAQLLAVVAKAGHENDSAERERHVPINYLAAVSKVQFKQHVEHGVEYSVHVRIVKRFQQLLYAIFYARVGDAEIASGTLVVTDYTK